MSASTKKWLWLVLALAFLVPLLRPVLPATALSTPSVPIRRRS
jgi:hypothetical protein